MGLFDREYMRPTASRAAGRFVWSATHKIIALNLALFLFLWLFSATSLGDWTYQFALLSPRSITHYCLWTLLTYGFFHAGIWHLFGNMLGLWLAGRSIENITNARRLLLIYGGGIFLGGLCWLLPAFFSWREPLPLLGASAGVFSLLTYALLGLFHQTIRIPFFPVTLHTKWVLGGLLFITLAGAFLSEIPATTGWWPVISTPSGIAHTAHFGGMLCGSAFFLVEKLQARTSPLRRKITPLRQTISVTPRPGTNIVDFSYAPGFTSNRETELNRILDKISRSGLATLSPAEKTFLEQESRKGPFS